MGMLKLPTGFKFFLQTYPKDTAVVIFMLITAGFAEAFGVMAFLPFLQTVLEGQATLDSIPEGVIRDFLIFIGLPLNFGAVSLFIIATISVKALIIWAAMWKVSVIVSLISHDLRMRFIDATLKAQWSLFTNTALGSHLNSLIMETHRASLTFISAASFLASVIQFFVYVSAAVLVSWTVSLYGFVIGIVFTSSLWFLLKIARRAGQDQTDIQKAMLSDMGDIIQAVKPTRAMNLERHFFSILEGSSSVLRKAQRVKLLANKALQTAHEPLMVIAAVLALMGMMFFGELSNSEIALMAVIFIRMMMGLNRAQAQYQSYVIEESGLVSLLASIEHAKEHEELWPGTQVPPINIESVRFDGVSFAYDDESKVLDAVSFKFSAQSLTIIQGESGSGKTTVLDVLCGFYKPDSGLVCINDADLGDINLHEWRKTLGFVPQDVFLLNRSIAENIAMGRSDLNDEDIWNALKAAEAESFVKSLPENIHAPVGENGRFLSGGQRQRVAIARAIVHKPQILILDEATSALDMETEEALLSTFKKLSQTMMVVMASHSQVALTYADKVIQIQKGQIKNRKAAL
jgi:ATP-binding cassette subfamily C protein